MKKIFLITIFLIAGIVKNYSQGWQWKNSILDSKILKDANDNLYVFSNNSPNFTIVKLDVNGTTLWMRTATGNAVITAYKIDGNNNLILLGNLTSSTTIGAYSLIPKGQQSFFILKLSPNSSVLSANVYGSSGKTFANDLFINANGDYLIGGGFTGTFDMNGVLITGGVLQNFFIVKTDNNQNVLWSEKSTLFTFSGETFLNELVENISGKMYATITMFDGLVEYNGYQFSSSGQYLIQLDNSRNITWTDYLGYPGGTKNHTTDIQTMGDTVYMKERYSDQYSTRTNTIYRWTDEGVKTSKVFNLTLALGYSVVNEKIYYAFLAANAQWNVTFYYRKIGCLTPGLSEQSQPVDSNLTLSGNYSEVQYINATSSYIGGVGEGMNTPFAGKFNMSAANSVSGNNNESNKFQIFPNPTKGQFTLKLNESLQKQIQYEDMIFIFDQSGKCILRQQFFNSSTLQIDISKMTKGVYFIEVETAKERINKKIVLN